MSSGNRNVSTCVSRSFFKRDEGVPTDMFSRFDYSGIGSNEKVNGVTGELNSSLKLRTEAHLFLHGAVRLIERAESLRSISMKRELS